MQKMDKSSFLVKRLSETAAIDNNSTVIGFSEGPKKNGKIVTLYFENESSQGYTENELLENGYVSRVFAERYGLFVS